MKNIAIVKSVPDIFNNAISDAGTSKLIDVDKARLQHSQYIDALSSIGLRIVKAPPDAHVDSPFVEDTAIITDKGLIITNLREASRKDEIQATQEMFNLLNLNRVKHQIEHPGYLEGGDVLFIQNKVFIGISRRTNIEGANQLKKILEKENFSVEFIEVKNCLHLKSGLTAISDDVVICTEEFKDNPALSGFKKIILDKDEEYAANCLKVNDALLVPMGYPGALEEIRKYHNNVIELDMSEFKKADGGLTCLSLLI